jgi:hypothetical protein
MTSYKSKRYRSRCNLGLIDDVLEWVAVYGYFAGGYTGGYVATTDRIQFSDGITVANTVSNLSQARHSLAGLSDKIIYGYFSGGISGGGSNTSLTDGITFSTGATSANTVSNLSVARYGLAGLSDGSLYGYFAGGNTGAAVATADRIQFSDGVRNANTVSNLSQARYGLTGLSDGLLYGYFAGGNTTGGNVALTDKITFSSAATSANTVSNLSVTKQLLASLSDGSTYGYFAGGYSGSSTDSVITDRITFSNGITIANTASNLSIARYGLAGCSDGISYGYFAGGHSGGYCVITDRIQFSDGVTSANTVSNLSQARHSLAGLSDFAV